MKKTSKCKMGLEPNLITRKVYERETMLCKDLAEKNEGFCCWGECNSCGVFALLYKLHFGKLLEDREEIVKKKRSEYKRLGN